MAPPLVLTLSGDSSSIAISDPQPRRLQGAQQGECGEKERGWDLEGGERERGREDERKKAKALEERRSGGRKAEVFVDREKSRQQQRQVSQHR